MTDQTFTIYAGRNESLAITLTKDDVSFEPGADWTLLFTLKRDNAFPDRNARFQKETGTGLTTATNTSTVAILPRDTRALGGWTYPFDIQATKNSDGTRKQVAVGFVTILAVTGHDSTPSVPIYTTSPGSGGGGGGTTISVDANGVASAVVDSVTYYWITSTTNPFP